MAAKGSIWIAFKSRQGQSQKTLIFRKLARSEMSRNLEANAPAGRSISVGLTDNALTLDLDSSGGGNLFINEVAGGKTATALGLLNNAALGTGPLSGRDLNPTLQPTTKLTELFGRYAQTTLTSVGTDDDLRIMAKTRGASLNGYSFNFVDDGSVIAGGELVTFNSGTNTFTVISTRAAHHCESSSKLAE